MVKQYVVCARVKMALKVVVGIAMWMTAVMSHGSMVVDKAILHYEPGGSTRQDVQITNPDAQPLYVKVEILEVLNPGTDKEERVEVKNPKKSKFLVTPNKLVVAPGARKLVRLVNLAKLNNKERVFRINLVPVSADVETAQTSVKVLVGYQLLVLIQPQKPSPDLKVERVGNTLKFHNAGNTNVLLRSGVQCAPIVAGGECEELVSHRLYAGNKWELDLKYGTPAEFIIATGSGNQKVVY